MDNVDRMFRHLVRTIRARFPQYLTQPFDVGELYLNILPYRHNRRELALQSNDDYEITLTELLSGARDYMIVGDDMRDALKAQLASVNPDPSAFKQFAGSRVALSPVALRTLDVGPTEELGVAAAPTRPAPTQPAGRTASATPVDYPNLATNAAAVAANAAPASVASPLADRATRDTTSPPPLPATPRTTPGNRGVARQVTPQPGDRCRSCDEELPLGRAIVFCPHCGQNLTTVNCPACGSELELSWRFCPACGRPATPP